MLKKDKENFLKNLKKSVKKKLYFSTINSFLLKKVNENFLKKFNKISTKKTWIFIKNLGKFSCKFSNAEIFPYFFRPFLNNRGKTRGKLGNLVNRATVLMTAGGSLKSTAQLVRLLSPLLKINIYNFNIHLRWMPHRSLSIKRRLYWLL